MPAYQRLLAVFGNGQHGRLGLASVASQLYPAICSPLQQLNVASVACGGGHTVVLAGASGCSQIAPRERPAQAGGRPMLVWPRASARCRATSAAADDGSVHTFGLNDSGQLGHSEDEPFVPVSVLLPAALAGRCKPGRPLCRACPTAALHAPLAEQQRQQRPRQADPHAVHQHIKSARVRRPPCHQQRKRATPPPHPPTPPVSPHPWGPCAQVPLEVPLPDPIKYVAAGNSHTLCISGGRLLQGLGLGLGLGLGCAAAAVQWQC
jgi:hypothetical protein